MSNTDLLSMESCTDSLNSLSKSCATMEAQVLNTGGIDKFTTKKEIHLIRCLYPIRLHVLNVFVEVSNA